MRVNVYDVEDGSYALRTTCDLDDCYPDRDGEYYEAQGELSRVGRYWAGGGAAPLVLLMVNREN